VLALWLTKQGVSVRIIDKTAEPGTASRALAVHARTLELYEQLGLAEPVVAKGYTVPGFRLWIGGRAAARVPFEEIVSDLPPYHFLHIFPQDEHERLLIERLQDFGVQVERSTELLGYSDEGDYIGARLRGADGAESTVTAAYLLAATARSRKSGRSWARAFLAGPIRRSFTWPTAGEGPPVNGDLNGELDDSDFLAIFPLADKGRVRLIGAIKPSHGTFVDNLTFEDVSDRAAQNLKLEVEKVNWFSVYHVHHRVTDRFRQGRAFILGDAAHIHTPVGEQGMNTGIGDAINLAWKLQAVLTGGATDVLLNTFEAERRAFALRLVQTTDRFFNVAAAEGHLAEIIRTRVAPIVLPQMVKFEAAREYIFRTISQITLNYRGMGLDEGQAGPVHGGDRLPWVKMDGSDNYRALRRIGWQIHLYGKVDDYVKRWAEGRRIPLDVYAWTEDMRHAGLRENALYLIRPDTYVALALPAPSVDAVEHYLAKVQINPSPDQAHVAPEGSTRKEPSLRPV
jgi:2-polyprenyl-6-methoxyphenol hydroxylase-like FAD-dependent oxidoreductase